MKTFFSVIRRLLDASLGTGYWAWIGTMTAFGIGVSIGQYGPALMIEQVHAASEVKQPIEQTSAGSGNRKPGMENRLPGEIKPVTASPSVAALSSSAPTAISPPRSGSKESRATKGKVASKTSASNKKAKHGKATSATKAKPVQANQAALPASKNNAPDKSADASAKTVEALSKPAAAPSPVSAAPESRAVKSPRGSADDLARAGDAIALGRNSEALTLLRKVLAADPLNFDARSSLIALLAERGRNDEWLAELSEAAEVSPERFALTAASAHFEMNRVDDASAILSRMPPTLRDFRHYAFAGVIYTRLQQYAPALSSYDKALAMSTSNASKRRALQVARGVALENLGRKDEARSAYQATIDEGGSASALSFARTRLANLDLDAVSVDRP